jgi:hypothetical protein
LGAGGLEGEPPRPAGGGPAAPPSAAQPPVPFWEPGPEPPGAAEADGSRYAVLDFMVAVPVAPAPEWAACQHVLGFDWGVRMLVTASVVNLNGQQIGHPFFLDTGPFDGRQARLRRQIDRLKAKVAALEQQRERFPVDDARRTPAEAALPVLRREISRCWRKYDARNNDLAYLAANILLTLATAFGCQLIAGESLKTMTSAGRGRDTRGRWRKSCTALFNPFPTWDAGGATVSAAGSSGPPDPLRKSLLQWLVRIGSPSLLLCHPDHASALWLRCTKGTDNRAF